jgi:predicted Zn-dependent peptidase
MHFDLTTLPNGLRVITEPMAGIRSAAVGCWVDTGTRDEADSEAGASHFLEHLLFKGSEHLSAREISERFDAMGAQSNAFTSKDYTCFWARLLDADLAEGFELLAEMLQRPAFRPEEIDSERQVVIEEINMNDDDPGDLAHEQFFQAVFAGHPLERPVLGTRESITKMMREDLAGYWKRRYQAGSAVVAVAGSVEHSKVVELAAGHFGAWDGGEVDHDFAAMQLGAHARVVNRPTEQAHLVIGGRGLKRDDDRRFAFEVLNHVLGGGLSSRLFRIIREERGLAYAVYSFRAPYADAGAWGVYAGTTPSQAHTVLELILAEIGELITAGVTIDELDRAKGNMRGGMALALEDPNSRMVRLGRDELTGMEHLSVDEKIDRIEAVTAAEVQEVAETVLTGNKVIGAVGPFAGVEFEEFLS